MIGRLLALGLIVYMFAGALAFVAFIVWALS